MAYIAAADFRERLMKPWTANVVLTEADGSDAYLDLIISQVTTQIELDLDDDFEPAGGDPDETIFVQGTIGSRLYVPRRVRVLTSVSSRSLSGTLTALSATSYRLVSSLNAAGTAMVDGRKLDWLDSRSGNTWYSDGGIQLVGKFGWAAVPTDIKRLAALRVYGLVKATSDPMTVVTQKTTVDAVFTYGPSVEEQAITERYNRTIPVTVA
jgi:hypothetical protein